MTTEKPRGKVTLEPDWLTPIWSKFPGNDLSGKLRWAIHEQIKQMGDCSKDCPFCKSEKKPRKAAASGLFAED